MTIANRNALLKLCQRRYIDLTIGDRGITVRLQSLSEKEKSTYETQLIAKSGKGILRERLQDATRRLIALCLVDENNERVFVTDSEIEKIGDLDSFVSSKIYDACQEHAGFNKEDISDSVKNCPEITDDDLPSD